MHRTVRRVLVYLLVSAVCYAIAVFFVDNQTAFFAVFGLGLLVGIAAEVRFWAHIIRLPRNRRQASS